MQDELGLTFSSAAPRARASASPDSEKEWQTRVVTWPSSLSSFCVELVRAGYSGRMSPVSSQAATTSDAFSEDLLGESLPVPPKDGAAPASSNPKAPTGTGSPGGFSMLSISESLSAAVVSSLSDILETGDLPQRFFLSAKACLGILRRAKTRGKDLPPALQTALERATK